MTTTRILPVDKIVGYLRSALTDYNSANRSGAQWIYPDRPRVKSMLANVNNFPRVGIETQAEATISTMSMDWSDMYDSVRFMATIWAPKGLVCTSKSISSESHTFVSGTSIYEMDDGPITTVTTITGTYGAGAYTFVQGTDYSLIDNDSDMHSESIEWLGVHDPDNSTDFYVTYSRVEEGRALCHHIARDMHVALRDNWRGSDVLDGLWNYRKNALRPVTLDEQSGIFRYELEFQFEAVNPGD